MNFKKIVEILAASVEFRDALPNRPTDVEALPKLISAIEAQLQSSKQEIVRPNKRFSAPYCTKAFYLLHAHFLRIPVQDEGLQRDLEFVIENSLHLVLGQLQISLARGWLITSISCMNVCQMLVSAVYDTVGYEQQFLQLPHLTSDILKHFRKKALRNVTDFLALPEADRSSLLRTLSPQAIDDVVRIGRSIPVVEIAKAEFVTLGESKVIAGGLVTLIVRLQVKNGTGALSPTASPTTSDRIKFEDLAAAAGAAGKDFGEDALDDDDDYDNPMSAASRIAPKGPKSNPNDSIYAPYLGTLDKKPFWWVILAEPRMNNFICAPVRLHDLVTSKVAKMQFVAPSREGTYQFVLYVKSDSYIGVDLRQEVKVMIEY